MSQPQTKIFVSYSQSDRKWLERLLGMLTPMVRKDTIDTWDDSKILPGSKWYEEIKKAIASAQIALLLVSVDFLASDFIMEDELVLLHEAEKHGLTIHWIAVGYTLYQETEFAESQALNNPAKPLSSFSGSKLEKELMSICKKIKKLIDSPQDETTASPSNTGTPAQSQ